MILIVAFILVTSGCSIDIEIEPQRSQQISKLQTDTSYHTIFLNETENLHDYSNDKLGIPIHNVNLDMINYSVSSSLLVGVGGIIDVYRDNSIVLKIIIKEVISGEHVLISINNQKSIVYDKGTIIRIREPHFFRITDIIYSDNEIESGVVVNIYSHEIESHPEILIEENIGLHRYRYSIKIENLHQENESSKTIVDDIGFIHQPKTYIANYGNANVTIHKNKRFVSKFIDNRNVVDYKEDRLYVIKDKESVAWVSFIENVEHVIEVNGFYDAIIKKYLEKYPSHITSKTFCDKHIWLEENDFWTEFFEESYININLKEISTLNLDTRIMINNIELNMSIKDYYNMNETLVVLDELEINPRGVNRVKICFV